MQIERGMVAVVTCAGSGIGLAMSNAFAALGCSVVLADVQQDALDAAAAEVGAHGVDTLAVLTDVSSADQVAALVADWQGTPGLRRSKTPAVRIIAHEAALLPGPRLTEVARAMARGLHPEVFEDGR